MPVIKSKVTSLRKKISEAIKKELNNNEDRSFKTQKPKRKKKTEKGTISCLFTTRSLSRREDRYSNLHITRRENQISLTCKDSQDSSQIKKRSTFYGSFVSSPSVNTNTIFMLAESNDSFSKKAVVHFSSLNDQLSHTKSCESVYRNASKLESSCAPSCKTFGQQQKLCFPLPNYSKVIPFDDSMGEVYPRRPFDSKAPLNWLDIQAWYSIYLEERILNTEILPCSKSDTAMDDIYLHCPSNYSRIKRDMTMQYSDALHHERFGVSNEEYLNFATNIGNYQSSKIKLYVKTNSDQPGALFGLCRLKTNLILICLQTFFSPFGHINIKPEENLDDHIKKMENECYDVFQRKISTSMANKLQAILYLTEQPAKLLRHKDLTFLKTLAVVLGLQENDIAILLR